MTTRGPTLPLAPPPTSPAAADTIAVTGADNTGNAWSGTLNRVGTATPPTRLAQDVTTPNGAGMPLAPPTQAQADLVRQGERTVDNLKRLFAFIFSLSFALIGGGAIDKIKLVLIGQEPSPAFDVWLLNAEMLTIFVITAGVFFHQSAKYLDNRYARHPLTPADPFGFARDYLTQALTVAPFFFMAFAFSPFITHNVGYIWFFGFYLVLFIIGLFLLFLAIFRHDAPIIYLHIYWFLMNSAMLLIILVVFQVFVWAGAVCPTSPSNGNAPAFLFLFGVLAFLRDLLDYRYAWRFVYPIDPQNAGELDLWPVNKIRESAKWRRFSIISGIIFIIITIVLICGTLQLWDFAYWAKVCKITHPTVLIASPTR